MIVQVRRQWRVASLLVMATAILVAFGTTPARAGGFTADLAVTKAASTATVVPGGTITYTITVTNNGPDATVDVTLSDVVPTGTTFVSLTAPPGFACTTPAVGGTGTVFCVSPPGVFLFPNQPATFTLVVKVNPDICGLQTQITNTATVSSTISVDPNPANNTSPTVITNVNCGYPLAVSPAAPSDAAAGAAAGPFQPSGGESRPWRPYVVFVAVAGLIALEAGLARRQRRGPTP